MRTSQRPTPPIAWIARGSVLAAPLLMAPAFADATATWTAGERTAAEVGGWAAWALALVVTFVPRPLALTAFRLLAGATVAATGWLLTASDPADASAAVVAGVLLASLAVSADVSEWFANGAGYDRERRLPLRAPWVLRGLAALTVATTTVAIGAGPVLLTTGATAAGVLVTVVGSAAAARLGRSLHALSRRWIVVVPGGLVIHDPLVLANPVLLPRRSISAVEPGADRSSASVDLTLGTRSGSVTIALRDPVRLPRRRGRRQAEVVETRGVRVSLARPGALLRAFNERLSPAP